MPIDIEQDGKDAVIVETTDAAGRWRLYELHIERQDDNGYLVLTADTMWDFGASEKVHDPELSEYIVDALNEEEMRIESKA